MLRAIVVALVVIAGCSPPTSDAPKAKGFFGGGFTPSNTGSTGTGGGITGATTPLQVSGSTVLITTTGAKEGYVTGYDGSAWGVLPPDVPYKSDVLLFDDFFNGGISNQIFMAGAAGTGAGCATNGSSIAAATHPGINSCATGSTATGRSSAQSGVSSIVFGGGVYTFEALVGVSALSSATDGYAIQIGFIDATTLSQVDGCYFEYDERNAAAHNASNLQKWIVVCASNSVRTAFLLDGSSTCEGGFGTSVNQAVAALTLPDTNWYKLKIVINAAASQASFYVNGTESCRIATNIPAAAARSTAVGWLQLKSVGTAAVLFNLDWLRLKVALTSSRT